MTYKTVTLAISIVCMVLAFGLLVRASNHPQADACFLPYPETMDMAK
jgi:hypothetical protein